MKKLAHHLLRGQRYVSKMEGHEGHVHVVDPEAFMTGGGNVIVGFVCEFNESSGEEQVTDTTFFELA